MDAARAPRIFPRVVQRHPLFSIALFFGLAGRTGWLTTRRSVPSYGNKNVYDWMMETSSSAWEDNPGLMAIGSNAVPFLGQALLTESTRYDRYAWVRRPGFQKVARRLR